MSDAPFDKPQNCKCGFPKIVARNLTGHDEKCPVHIEWLEQNRVALTPKRNQVKVKSSGGNHLFLFYIDEQMIKINRRGTVYRVYLRDLIEFCNTSEREVFWAPAEIPDKSDDADDVVRQGFE